MIRELVLATTLLMTLSAGAAVAQEMPPPPATFFGTVKVDGHSVSDGTAVTALIGGKVCGEGQREPGQKGTWTATEPEPGYGIETGDSLYAVDVVSDSQISGCGTEGTTVTFLIDGKPAHQKGLWIAGPNPLNLTVGTPPRAEQPPTAPAGEEPAPSPSGGQEASDDGGFNWWPAVGGGLGLVAVVGLAGLWQARRVARRKQA